MTRPIKVGIQLPEVERVVGWRELAEMARAAETIGLDSLWVGDHLFYRYPDGETRGPWEAWSVLSALATVTERVTIGPLVACVSFHNPAVLAKMAADVDAISGGRLVLGLGAGWNEAEYRAFGMPYDHRVSRFADAFAIISGLLRDGRVDYHGRYHSAPDCELHPPPARPGGPPLLVGSSGARMLAVTVPVVQAWNAWYTTVANSVEGYLPIRERVDAACRAVGRDPATLERTLALLVGMPGAAGRPSGDPDERQPAALDGDPGRLAESLAAFAAEGVAHVQLVMDPITIESVTGLEPMLARLDR